MELKKISRLAAIVMLITIFNPAYCGVDDEFSLPDAPKSEAQAYYDQVPVEKRDVFIRYFLGEGLKAQGEYIVRSPRIVSINVEEEFGEPPAEFATKLLTWTKSTFEMEDEHVRTLVDTAYVCFPSKGCYDPSDIGSHCCPV